MSALGSKAEASRPCTRVMRTLASLVENRDDWARHQIRVHERPFCETISKTPGRITNVTSASSGPIAALLSLIALLLGTGPTPAQQTASDKYPSKPIHLIVGFAAGGGNDIIARIVGQKLQDSLGQTVIVENRVGAGGRLSAGYVAAQPSDGYTLLVGASGAMAISPPSFPACPM